MASKRTMIYRRIGGKELHDYIAHQPAVIQAIRDERDRIYRIAESIWAKHNRPGGHSIGKANGITDAYIYLEGPVPHIVEWGRAGYVTKKPQRLGNIVVPAGTHIKAWAGTQVLTTTLRRA